MSVLMNSHPRVPLERDNSEEFLKREARAAQLAEEIEASATYKARVALENDDRSEEEKYSAVVRDTHTLSRSDIGHHAGNNYTSAFQRYGHCHQLTRY